MVFFDKHASHWNAQHGLSWARTLIRSEFGAGIARFYYTSKQECAIPDVFGVFEPKSLCNVHAQTPLKTQRIELIHQSVPHPHSLNALQTVVHHSGSTNT
jgi:hypothetical protein